MKKKILSIVMAGAAAGAVLAGAMGSATASTSGSVGTNQTTYLLDTGVTPAGATLHVALWTDAAGAHLWPTVFSTPNLITYSAYLSWTCSNGFSQIIFQPALVTRNGIDGLCPGAPIATGAFAAIDDL